MTRLCEDINRMMGGIISSRADAAVTPVRTTPPAEMEAMTAGRVLRDSL